jgi:hypothetical protein
MLPARAPPVILLVSAYWKSAKHTVEVERSSANPMAAANDFLIYEIPPGRSIIEALFGPKAISIQH